MSSLTELACNKQPDKFTSSNSHYQEQVKHLCLPCPIAPKCLADCLDYEETSGETMIGVYGGTTTAERRRAAEIRRSA